MKYHGLLLTAVYLILSGCSPKPTQVIAANTSTPIPTSTATATETVTASPTVPLPTPEPVTVLAYCTLLGRDATINVASGTPIIIQWGWKALTEAQVQDYIDNAVSVVTLDGIALEGLMEDTISQSTSTGDFLVSWFSDVGILSPGMHTITYDVSWQKMISDGADTYGPGGVYETVHDECQIVVN